MKKLTAILTLTSMIIALPLGIAADNDAADHERGDFVCGPRCVHFLLHYYDSESHDELVDIVRQCQWPDISKGSSLAGLTKILNKAGLYTAPAKMSSLGGLSWKYPVLLHLASESRDNPLGHFVVWMPTSTCYQWHLWTGLAGTVCADPADVIARMSGHILFTSPSPIDANMISQAGRPFVQVASILMTATPLAIFTGITAMWVTDCRRKRAVTNTKSLVSTR